MTIDKIKTNTNSNDAWACRIPFAGIGIGTLSGIAARALSGDWVGKPCGSAIAYSGLLQTVNGIKQWELKNFALATPLLPLAAQIALDTAGDKSGKRILSSLSAAAKKNFTLEQGIYLAAFAILGLTGTSYCKAGGMCSKEGFDPSGHMMLKTVCASILSKASSAIANKENRIWRNAFNALYTITDAVLIHNTVGSCHTVSEAIAGLAWGLGITSAAKFVSGKLRADQEKASSLIKTSR